MDEIKNKVLAKYGLIEGAPEAVEMVDPNTGEIIEEETAAPAKKTKKAKKLQ